MKTIRMWRAGAGLGALVVVAMLASVAGWMWQFRVFARPLLALLGVGG